jgi:hypothetical protein
MNSDAVLQFVTSNPGKTCEQIAAGMGEHASLVSVVLRALRKAGKLKSRGNTRGTKWRAAKP